MGVTWGVGDLLAVDPSIRSPGVAFFRDTKLVASGRVTFPIDTTLGPEKRCFIAADAIAEWAIKVGCKPLALACEWPQIYRENGSHSKTKGDANDVVYMAGVDMALVSAFTIAAFMRGARLETRVYQPAEWCGQLPKSTRGKASASPRGKRILSRLADDERAVFTDQHDAVDAIGIGLHSLGRLGVRHVNVSG